MMTPHSSLLKLIRALKVERVSAENSSSFSRFVGQSFDLGWGRVYGGQLLAQSLNAAYQTLYNDRKCHSFHSSFVRPGDVSKDVHFLVEDILDGRTISNRRVVALQEDKQIFHMQASFTDEDNTQASIQHSDMPDVPKPENLKTVNESMAAILHELPPLMQRISTLPEPILRKPVETVHPTKPIISEPVKHVWIKANGGLAGLDVGGLNECLAAYVSDADILPTSLLPLGKSVWSEDMNSATITHSMWFHSHIKIDQWLLYVMKSPITEHGRGFVNAHMYDTNAKLVATAIQEGIIRTK